MRSCEQDAPPAPSHTQKAARARTPTGRLPRRRAGLAGDSGAPGERRGDMAGDGREGDTEQLARTLCTLELRLLRRLLEGGLRDGDTGQGPACADMPTRAPRAAPGEPGARRLRAPGRHLCRKAPLPT